MDRSDWAGTLVLEIALSFFFVGTEAMTARAVTVAVFQVAAPWLGAGDNNFVSLAELEHYVCANKYGVGLLIEKSFGDIRQPAERYKSVEAPVI